MPRARSWAPNFGWDGVALRVRAPIERCVTTTYRSSGRAERSRASCAFWRKRRNAQMGIYCDVIEPGMARTVIRAPIN